MRVGGAGDLGLGEVAHAALLDNGGKVPALAEGHDDAQLPGGGTMRRRDRQRDGRGGQLDGRAGSWGGGRGGSPPGAVGRGD